MGFTKLDSGIINSSIWFEHSDVLKVFIAFWTKSDKNGKVLADERALFRDSCLVDIDGNPKGYDYFKKVLNKLMSEDAASKSKKENGKRILQIDASEWYIVNYEQYRDFSYSNSPDAIKKRKQRDKKGTCPQMSQSVPGHSVSVSASVSEYTKEFTSFWSMYPRKVGKGAAYRAWKKILCQAETLQLIESALKWQKESDQWTKDNGQFIPHPSTWLNQGRWDDEVSTGIEKGDSW